MPQTRYYNYDSNADSTSENLINYALHTKGVYRGLDVLADPTNKLTLSSGCGLQHDGVMWNEDATVYISFTPPVTTPASMTVVATHDNRLIMGGVGVLYEVRDGVFTDATVTNGIVLGWIYYPAGSGGFPLIQDYIVSAPKILSGADPSLLVETLPLNLIPAYPGSIVTSAGLDITFTPSAFDIGSYVVYQNVANDPLALGVEQLIQQIQLYVANGRRPYSISFYFYCNAPAATNLVVQVYGTDLVDVTPLTGTPITGSGVWEQKTVTIDRLAGVFDDGKPYTIRLTYNVAPGKEIRVGKISVNFWPYP